jgi:DnaJ like chaperone protein
MQLAFLLIIIGIFYLLTKNYSSKEYSYQKKQFHGDLSNHETGIIVALMAKVAKADGRVSELEAELISLTLTDLSNVFSNNILAREELKKIYNVEKESFENTIILASKYAKITNYSYDKSISLMNHLLNLAFIDGEFSHTEKMITEDIAKALNIRLNDYENLVKNFKEFYANRFQEKKIDKKRAYELFGLKSGASLDEVKKRYKELVRKYHPDLLMGKGESEDIIENATKKLQEINEAYELLKKEFN